MDTRERLKSALGVLFAVVVFATVGYRLLGRDVSWLDAVYMTVITLTSVGYGEIVDTSHNQLLRGFNLFVLTFGIGTMLYVFSVATAFVVEGDLKRIFWKRTMQKKIAAMRDHVIICGAGTTGLRVAEELYRTRRELVVIDSDSERLQRVSQLGDVPVIEGDASDEEVLESAGLDRAGGVVTALPNDKDNLVVVVTVRQKHPNVRIVARCVDTKMADKMIRAGASSTVSPNSIGGMRLASEMVRPTVVTFLDTMLREQNKTLRIEEIQVPYHSTWVGKTLAELGLRERYNLGCLALRAAGEDQFLYNPHDAEIVGAQMVIVVMGNVEDIQTARQAATAQMVRRA
jgi:voltage-gated potassium channel